MECFNVFWIIQFTSFSYPIYLNFCSIGKCYRNYNWKSPLIPQFVFMYLRSIYVVSTVYVENTKIDPKDCMNTA